MSDRSQISAESEQQFFNSQFTAETPEARQARYKARLDEMRAFSQGKMKELVPEIIALREKHTTNGEKPLTDEKKQWVAGFVAEANKVRLLDQKEFKLVWADPVVEEYINHDIVDNIANHLIVALGLLNRVNLPADKIAKYLNDFYQDLRDFFYVVMEDSMLRALESDKVKAEHYRELNVERLKRTLTRFVSSQAEGGRVRQLVRLEDLDSLGEIISQDEKVFLNGAVVKNGLANIIKNACKEKIGAKAVKIFIFREGDELVIQVANDGTPMASEYIDKESDKFIFIKGVTHDESGKGKGLGLANLDRRLTSMNANIAVSSAGHTFSTRKDQATDQFLPVNYHGSPEEKFNPVTIFEMRLPIIKKEKV